ncbi:MAG: T9SS type A sorting domain-containing protein [Saprospiraceae bacterium]
MKKLLLLLFLGSALLPLNAQNWFQNHPQWTNLFTAGWQGSGYEYVTVSGDTVLQGQSAIILQRSHIMDSSPDFVDFRVARQNGDTVWVWNPGQSAFYMQYNFSLSAGDSVIGPLATGAGQFRYYIDSVGTLDLNGHTFRFQKVHFYRNDNLYKCTASVIETIGCLEGGCLPNPLIFHYPLGTHLLVDEPNEGAVDGPDWYFCSFQNDMVQYHLETGACNGLISQQEPAAGEERFQVQPNPFQDVFSIVTSTNQVAGQLRIFNTAGRLIVQSSFPVDPISTDSWPAGFYFLEITLPTGNRQFCRAVKE